MERWHDLIDNFECTKSFNWVKWSQQIFPPNTKVQFGKKTGQLVHFQQKGHLGRRLSSVHGVRECRQIKSQLPHQQSALWGAVQSSQVMSSCTEDRNSTYGS